MGTIMSIWILVLHMNIVICTLDQVQDELIQNRRFQQEMIEKFVNLNLKFDTLQSTNIQLESMNRKLISKVDNLETKIYSIETENQEYSIQMQKQNKEIDFLQNQNKEIKSQMDKLIKNKNKKIKNPVILSKKEKFDEKLQTKRILVSDPQYTHSVELQLQDLNAKVDNNDMKQTNSLNSLQQNLQSQITGAIQHSNHGNVYIRWGRTTCPNINGTDLVYAGYSGGSWTEHTGAASNYLCMPKDPEFLSSQLYTINGWENFVYGVEYEEHNSFNGVNIYNHDAPCVVCRSERTAIMMIPARQHCDSGWTKEYSGFLVAGAYVQKASTEYVCLDAVPETEERDAEDKNGALFYYVFSKCGSLPCTPYKENAPLPCVVCSR